MIGDFIASYYAWIKAVHIIFVIFWCAGLLMLPRFFMYHSETELDSAEDLAWREREARLMRIIMRPAMIIAWIAGGTMAVYLGYPLAGWLIVKLGLVIGLSALHLIMANWRRDFVAGNRARSEKFYRNVNEIPSVIIIIVVILVVVKPF